MKEAVQEVLVIVLFVVALSILLGVNNMSKSEIYVAPLTETKSSAKVYAKEILKHEEGFSKTPYVDTEGYVTIGYGHRLSHKGEPLSKFSLYEVTQKQAELDLHFRINGIAMLLENGAHGNVYLQLSSARQAVIISMVYQMGYHGTLGFVNMWERLNHLDYYAASRAMLDSKWYIQTKERCVRMSNIMYGNNIANYWIEIGRLVEYE